MASLVSFRPNMVAGIIGLSEDILSGILFSGYLGHSFDQLLPVFLVCQCFKDVGYRTVGVLVARQASYLTRMVSCLTSLVFVDLQFAPIHCTPELMECFLCRRRTLRGLNMRATDVDDSCLPVIAQLTNLSLLVLSKAQRIPDEQNISDDGAMHLAQLVHLRWLDLSMTNITDEAVRAVCEPSPQGPKALTHLLLQCCARITSRSMEYIQLMPLKLLAVSSCMHMSADALVEGCTRPLTPLRFHLSTLDLSFLPHVSPQHIRQLMTCPNLRAVACRGKADGDRVCPPHPYPCASPHLMADRYR